MRRSIMTAVVLASGVIGFAAASPAGISPHRAQPVEKAASDRDMAARYAGAACRIERSMSVDFRGNPYMKKVRICA